ncbi:MAG TPA: glutamine--fructose-6-phosphate transaminase (isomerizing) [Chlamydiales bacterium]|nr:glutamine--fructose-6-phosphate transaminase (isomerizing) [Chlamydiales bacterium]
MCGIFGYVGKKNPINICMQGLLHLEYRGYDSTGIGGIHNGKIEICKSEGKLSNLKKKLDLPMLELAIAHTRWATHGKVNTANAHPLVDASGSIALIHNGIIENYQELKENLIKEGISFSSETDSEVVVNLIAKFYKGDLVQAIHKALGLLKGIFALLVIHKDHPKEIIATAQDCPLSIGCNVDKSESMISSDPNTFQGDSFDILFLKEKEIARVTSGCVEIFDQQLKSISKRSERLEIEQQTPSKEGFEHFMLKEIFEQPTTIRKALLGRFNLGIFFEELKLTNEYLKGVESLWILGCGTSSHAGVLGTYLMEDLARFPASVEIASEARYRNPILSKNTLVIAVSQSGETADLIAATREAQKYGCKTLGICNVKNSTLVREADGVIFLRAGPEISVCSTKAFTAQLTVFILLSLYFANLRKAQIDMGAIYKELLNIPVHIEQILDRKEEIQKIAKKYAKYDDFIFLGRRYMLPTAQESALKLKEISYVNANSYAAGELKHGPIALLGPNFPVIAFCANRQTREKIASNLMEVKARHAPVFAIAPENFKEMGTIADDVFYVPPTLDILAPFSSAVVGQLFAYYLAKERGSDIDQPRNLAKSVTVE